MTRQLHHPRVRPVPGADPGLLSRTLASMSWPRWLNPHLGVNRRGLMVALVVLTMTAGAADVISFLSLGQVFTALQTGNLMFLAVSLAGSGPTPAWRPALSFAAFTGGAILGAGVIRGAGGRRWTPAVMGLEAVLLAAAGTTALGQRVGSASTSPSPAVIALVALAMGVQSMAAQRVRIPGMSTQVIQGSLVTLVSTVVSRLSQSAEPPDTSGVDSPTVRRHSITIGSLFVGGLLGALLTAWGTGPALLTLAAVVLSSAAVYAFTPGGRVWWDCPRNGVTGPEAPGVSRGKDQL